ncbi:hypothetical protein N7474_010874 [Penicillium riverlandense]|uniref:uncharacterized protein n=1 Tax=Penicillium riverlandense TaxID=1903569 RepID=UPI002546AF48|nr:uncharacterized protein N7474_010874 [Penicillium riverlandense]KAJ5804987.1 hypothetical protein N7474_010874 [Penicillium riverlandense]
MISLPDPKFSGLFIRHFRLVTTESSPYYNADDLVEIMLGYGGVNLDHMDRFPFSADHRRHAIPPRGPATCTLTGSLRHGRMASSEQSTFGKPVTEMAHGLRFVVVIHDYYIIGGSAIQDSCWLLRVKNRSMRKGRLPFRVGAVLAFSNMPQGPADIAERIRKETNITQGLSTKAPEREMVQFGVKPGIKSRWLTLPIWQVLGKSNPTTIYQVFVAAIPESSREIMGPPHASNGGVHPSALIGQPTKGLELKQGDPPPKMPAIAENSLSRQTLSYALFCVRSGGRCIVQVDVQEVGEKWEKSSFGGVSR